MKIQQLLVAMLLVPCLSVSLSWANDVPAETVVIRSDGDNTYYEYRVNGEISEIKVVPKFGKPYYLVPATHDDGEFVRKDNPQISVPKWVIFRW
ncbi:MAG: DUF2782 domain-containing protein [Bacterioplanes sp.]|nr:DUF2782 domain-containing protein [Bacterioplanes sp.]